MHLSDDLLTVFSGEVVARDGSYVIELPEREIEQGALAAGETYRVALTPHVGSARASEPEPEPAESEPSSKPERDTNETEDEADERPPRRDGEDEPPVEAGDEFVVEIESLGDQGDGVARVEKGYVLIVPDTEVHERVTVSVTDVTPNVGFAEVVSRHAYYE